MYGNPTLRPLPSFQDQVASGQVEHYDVFVTILLKALLSGAEYPDAI